MKFSSNLNKTALSLFIVAIFFAGYPSDLAGQIEEKYKDHDGFHSVFQNLASGNFKGTANGVLFVKRNPAGNDIILDFQGGKADLKIEKDEYEMYDLSTKIYQGFTTSGRSQVKYETYASANGIAIQLNNEWYGLSVIDGACDMAIQGIEFVYKAESTAEYLILRISKELILTNWPILNEGAGDDTSEYIRRTIILLPESTLVFAIKR